MRAKLEINNAENIEATISLTMSLKDWQNLVGQFERCREGWVAWPAQHLVEAVSELVDKGNKTFYAHPEKPE